VVHIRKSSNLADGFREPDNLSSDDDDDEDSDNNEDGTGTLTKTTKLVLDVCDILNKSGRVVNMDNYYTSL